MNLNDYLKNKINQKQRKNQKHIFNHNLSQKNRYISFNDSSYTSNSKLTNYLNPKNNNSFFGDKNNDKISEIISYDQNNKNNTVNITEIKKIKSNFYNNSNKKRFNISNYIYNPKINNNKSIKNEKINFLGNNNSNIKRNISINDNFIFNYNDEVEYLNMKSKK